MAAPHNPSRLRYVLAPCWVTSERTGERVFVPARELVRLYGLGPGSYKILVPTPDARSAIKQAERRGLTVLYPRADGNYTLPDAPPDSGKSDSKDPPPPSPSPRKSPPGGAGK